MKRKANAVLDDPEPTITPTEATATTSTAVPPADYISGETLVTLSNATAFKGVHRKNDKLNVIVGDKFTYMCLIEEPSRDVIRWTKDGVPNAIPMGQVMGVSPAGRYVQLCSFGLPWAGTMETMNDEPTFELKRLLHAHTTIKIKFEREHVMLRAAAEMDLWDPRIDVAVAMQKKHGCLTLATRDELAQIKQYTMNKEPSQWETNGPTHVPVHEVNADDAVTHTVESMVLSMTEAPSSKRAR